MLKKILPLAIAASFLQPFSNIVYMETVFKWLVPQTNFSSLGQAVLALIFSVLLSLLTTWLLLAFALKALRIPHPFLIVLCSTAALFSSTTGSFTGIASYSRPAYYLLNVCFYLSVYALYYWVFAHTNFSVLEKTIGGLIVAVLMNFLLSPIWSSLNSELYRRKKIAAVESLDFVLYAPTKTLGGIGLQYFEASNVKDYSDNRPYLELIYGNPSLYLYERRINGDFNPPFDCGSIHPGMSLGKTYTCEKFLATPRGREVYARSSGSSGDIEYYVKLNDTLITFRQSGTESAVVSVEDFVDSFEPTNAAGLQSSSFFAQDTPPINASFWVKRNARLLSQVGRL